MRLDLTKFGVWTGYNDIGMQNAGEAAKLVEDLGYGVFWLGGSPEVQELRPLLAATETLIAATSIANIWKSDAGVVAAEAAALERDHGGRVLVGIGAGHPEATSDYAHPRHAMIEFLDRTDAASDPLSSQRRMLAALGPRMLDLAAERSLGGHPYFTVVEHTRFARERLGAEPLLAVELSCVVDGDPESARASASRYAAFYLGLSNYTDNLRRFGFTDADFADGGSDRLLDAVVPQGGAERIAEVVNAHLEAGADHVCLQPVGVAGIPRAEWTALARAVGL